MSRSTTPPVSIGLPVFNGERYLQASIDSILAQTFGDFELLISDNGSTDATEEICRNVAATDPRIRYEQLPQNLGAAANYNRLVHMAAGRYFKWASHDDVCEVQMLERCYEALEADRGVVLAYPKTMLIDGDGAVIGPYEDRLDLRQPSVRKRLSVLARSWNMCNPAFGLIDRDRLLDTSLIGTYIGSDVTLLAELALRGRFHEVPERLFRRRIHSRSSRQGDLTLDEVAAWFDPRNRRAPRVSPATRVMAEIVRSIRASELDVSQQIACSLSYCTAWGVRRVRVRGGRLKARIAHGWG